MIFVTGATGFLGHNLVAHLVAEGHPVRALVRPTSDTRQLRELGVELCLGDVRDRARVAAALAGCEFVVHGAGLFRFWGDPATFERINAEGTANVMDAARRHGAQKVVHISTVAVVGRPPAQGEIDELTPCHPQDAYQRSKVDGENLVRDFWQRWQLPVVILRPGAFYGPWGHYAFNRLFFEDPLRGLLIRSITGGASPFRSSCPTWPGPSWPRCRRAGPAKPTTSPANRSPTARPTR